MANRTFRIRFWGVRGTIPSPGPKTIKYGGNTPCVEVRCDEQLIILDAGSGLRKLGLKLLKEMPINATLLLSHLHWDHIHGFPFFAPADVKGNKFHIYAERKLNNTLHGLMAGQMMYPHFPLIFEKMAAEMFFTELIPGENTITIGDVNIQTSANNHPDGSLSFKITYDGVSMVYATDTEHYSCVDPALLKLAGGANCLIYDSTFTPEEYCGQVGTPKTGWGHSTWEEGIKLAKAAGIGQLILFHHEPDRSDDAVGGIEKQAAAELPGTIAAYEGLEIVL